MHNFVLVALVGAIAYSISNILQKHLVGQIDEYAVAWSRYLFASPFLLLFLWRTGIPKINPTFWPIVVLTALVEVLIAVIWAKALKKASISKTVPFLAFQPLFVAIGGFLILRESLSFLQIVAVLAIVIGSYILNVTKDQAKDIFAPIKLVWKEKGGLYILCLCVIWGIDVPFSKRATLYSSPELFTTVFFVLTSLFFIPLFMKKSEHGFRGVKKNFLLFALTGFFTSIFMVTLFMAAKLGPIAIVSAIMSTNILITVLFAGTFLKEKGIVRRIVATSVMTLGAVLLTIR